MRLAYASISDIVNNIQSRQITPVLDQCLVLSPAWLVTDSYIHNHIMTPPLSPKTQLSKHTGSGASPNLHQRLRGSCYLRNHAGLYSITQR